MSEKQHFNKEVYARQIAEKRRERWMSRKLLTEILEVVRMQRNDANWILYQVLRDENERLSYKAKVKMFKWLANAGYDVEKLRPEKKDKTFSYLKTWQEYKDIPIIAPSFNEHMLYQQLDKANELLNEIYTHLTEKAVRTAWETKEDCKKFTEILDKIKKRFTDENNK